MAHICKGIKGATENFFQWYKDTIEAKLCDNLRKKMGYNGGPINKRFRIVLMKDGGIPQAKSTIQEAGMLKRMDRHELDLKHAKSKSLVAQPCDVCDGHRKEKSRLKKITREDATSDILKTEHDGAYKKSGYDWYGALRQLLRKGSKQWRKSRLPIRMRDLEVFIRDVLSIDHVSEDTFTRLGICME